MNKGVIAVCIVRMDENVQTDSIKAITQRAEEQGLYVEIYNSFVELQNHDLHDKGEESVYDIIDYKHLSGIILFPEKIKFEAINEKILRNAKAYNIPVVTIDRCVDDAISITYDYAGAIEEITEHLINVHNCRDFVVMAGMPDNKFSDERVNAIRSTFVRYGIDFSDDDIYYGDFWDAPCRKAMAKFFESGKKLPDAFIAVNDTMAITICDELNKRGYSVPEDVIVTGFDGIALEKYAVPRLTTAETDLVRSGYLAVDAIVSHNRGAKNTMSKYVVPFHTRFSQSCGCQSANCSVNAQLQELYVKNVMLRNYYDLMADMIVGMTSCVSLLDMIKAMEGIVGSLENYNEMYICLRRDEIDIDTEMMKRVEWLEGLRENDEARNAIDRQMVLFWEYHKGEGATIPLKAFRMREQIPYRDSVLDEVKNLVYLPLHVQDKVFGYLAVGVMPHRVNHDYYELYFLSRSLSQSIASVLQTQKISSVNDKLSKANEKLEKLYITDPLTEVNNRRGFYRELDKKRNIDKYNYVMIVSVDLDGLKRINDNYGHIEGDKAIIAMASILRDMTDSDSVCARFGGDEYAYCKLFREEPVGEDVNFKNELNKRIEYYNETRDDIYSVGASTGVEISKLTNVTKLDELLKKADAKMYAEKERHHKGRR